MSMAIHLVFLELAFVVRTLAGRVLADPVLAALEEVAFVARPVGVRFYALARLFVRHPTSLVLCSAWIDVLAGAVHATLVPLPLEGGAVRHSEHTKTVRLPIFQAALVAAAVGSLQKALLLVLVLREHGVEPVLYLRRLVVHELPAELLPVPVVSLCGLASLFFGPVLGGKLVHYPAALDVSSVGFQHLGRLSVPVGEHAIHERLALGPPLERLEHALVLVADEDRVLPVAILAACPAEDLDPLALRRGDPSDDEQQAAFVVDVRVHHTVVVASATLRRRHRDGPLLLLLGVGAGQWLRRLLHQLHELQRPLRVVEQPDDAARGSGGAAGLSPGHRGRPRCPAASRGAARAAAAAHGGRAAAAGGRTFLALRVPCTRLSVQFPKLFLQGVRDAVDGVGTVGHDEHGHLRALLGGQLHHLLVLLLNGVQRLGLLDVLGDLLAAHLAALAAARVQEEWRVERGSLVVLREVLALRALPQRAREAADAGVRHVALQSGQDGLLVLVFHPLGGEVVVALDDLEPEAPASLDDLSGLGAEHVHPLASLGVVAALHLLCCLGERVFHLLLQQL
mmetsp:Transcript_17572/g.46699  ORF Transcript_17572/g.46699 Transcript_17572/m.46699 type:complete len:567 (-) Transcript_17572:1414-3114(-)